MNTEEESDSFKKPVFVPKTARLPKPIPQKSSPNQDNEQLQTSEKESKVETNEQVTDISSSVYQEPIWSGKADTKNRPYTLEVLKNGSIIENINLMDKAYHIIGRLNTNDICMQHPTVSRHHAVVQYRAEASESDDVGFYIYDLGSTHGTFLNKMKIKPKIYARIKVGHVLKLGCSSRMLILTGPEEDAENESELTVTELKQQRQDEIQRRKDLIEAEERAEELKRKKIEEAGVDWGMGEDAEEEPDLSENPFAQTTNEELYLDNPKTTLRGFFEREGLDLEYDCKEQGIGQFFCRVELPLDDDMGRPIYAEVTHKGKKKEAVVQCALEACRILDRYGVLRQSTHESRKRKPKNWEENDYYDSDDDTFLDRTGIIERKREKRMKAKQPQKAETYECLLERDKELSAKIGDLESKLTELESKVNAERQESGSELDPLDSFMMELKEQKPDKQSVKKLKLDLANLQNEQKNVQKLINIARPASLPPLITNSENNPGSSNSNTANLTKKSFPIFGKRKKIQVQLPSKPETKIVNKNDKEEEEKEEENVKMSENEVNERLAINSVSIHEQFVQKIKELINNKAFKNIKIKLIEVDHKIDNAASDGIDLSTFQNQQQRILDNINTDVKTEEILQLLDELLDDIKSAKPKEIVVKKDKVIPNKTVVIGNEPKKKAEGKKRKQKDTPVEKYDDGEDYESWVPPTGQTGDGRTALNDKFGY